MYFSLRLPKASIATNQTFTYELCLFELSIASSFFSLQLLQLDIIDERHQYGRIRSLFGVMFWNKQLIFDAFYGQRKSFYLKRQPKPDKDEILPF